MTDPDAENPYVPDEPGTVDLIVRIAQVLAGDWMPDLGTALEADRTSEAH
ncbi:hypothetical protein [Mycobacterium avium]|uniref:Uncharacterized protein n=1 Tax=Mycobacterium avium (strain 104) TaxID=243243 RepID=A0A0H2ZYX1_MYCA1|nr:hypothetical protein [Mycobacterium avium]ABK67934.1 hypothetical protein MAV_0257 [Mycobacterium avium 104]KDP09287.1 hypothetical protein MAV101_01295 [Mycobacterium avium subsp. hominissuis 101]MCG3243031.1 hypothetical protein [Mycobacterium avium subsp. hominissuis]